MDPQQLILLVIATIVPLTLFAMGRTRLILGWVGITLAVHIFDTTTITNLPAGRIVGLLFLPTFLLNLRMWLRLPPVRAWLVNFLYLLVLGVIFGVLWPWPDSTGARAFTLTAPGRFMVYSVRLLADVALTAFVARELRKPGSLLYLGRAIVGGAALTALAGLVTVVSPATDMYFAITGLRDLNGLDRPRGLSFEPRGLGQACAYGLMVLLVYPGRATARRLTALVITLLGLLISYSTSAFALFVAGVATLWLFLTRRVRLALFGLLLLAGALLITADLVAPERFDAAAAVVEDHLDPTARLRGAFAENIGQEIAYRLDSFDASAVLFLLANPQFALTGTGPGMMMLPASSYIPPGLFTLMYGDTGLDGLPTLGPLLEISNGGLISLAAWLVQVLSCWAALRTLAARRGSDGVGPVWSFGQALFLVGVVFYVVQTSITSPVWSVILGIGWAASATLDDEQTQQAAADSLQRGAPEAALIAAERAP
jgi:hypothetical protein